MKFSKCIIAGALLAIHSAINGVATESPIRHRLMLFEYGKGPNRILELDDVSKCPQVLGCQRLANGNTLVAEQGPCQAVEVSPKHEVVRVPPLKTSHESYHLQVRNIHKLANGNILAAHEGEGAVREV